MRTTYYSTVQRQRLARHAYADACMMAVSAGCWLCCANLGDALMNPGWMPPDPCPRCGRWLSRRAVQLILASRPAAEEAAA